MIRRRDFLSRALVGTGLLLAPVAGAQARLRQPKFKSDPFMLGVASGYPQPDGMVLWTRLAPQPLRGISGTSRDDWQVDYEIATDERFRRIVQTGITRAEAALAHSVHLEVRGLPSGREFFYRFHSGGYTSPVGRSWTAVGPDMLTGRLRIGVASCQHYEQGYYHAYRHMLQEGVDLILHLGDYIYEGKTARPVREHDPGECRSLEDYRLRYSWYRSDPVLQQAHAACPWLVTHDDHEVDNDYAALQAEHPEEQADFPARRAAAYQAYYEHMPLPRSARPQAGAMALYTARSFGSLLQIDMLDTRQYRSPQVCPTPPRLGGSRVFVDECPSWFDPNRQMLGETQEAWLAEQLQRSRSRWNILAQGMVFSLVDEDPGPRQQHWNDSWAGYPQARERLLQSVSSSGVANPLILGGDIHAFIAADQRLIAHDTNSPLVMSELVTTSISSGPPPKKVIEAYNREDSRDVHFADGDHRGYLRLDITPTRLRAELFGFESVRETRASAKRLAAFEVLAGERGLRKAY